MTRSLLNLLAITTSLALATSSSVASDNAANWPAWLGPGRDGKSADRGLLPQWPAGGPRLLWQADGIGSGFSNVAVADGRIYTTGDVDGKLVIFAFTMDGRPAWKVVADNAWTRSHPGSRSTPTIDGDRLYLLSGNGVIGCWDARDGAVQWTRNVDEFGGKPGGWGYAESILVNGDQVVVKPGGAQCIVALDKLTGRTAWTSSGFQAGPEYSSCIAAEFAGVPMIITGTRGGIVGVDARNGKSLWQNAWCEGNTANCPTPAYADGHVFWANGYGKGGICLKLRKEGNGVAADEAWTTREMVCHHGGYVIQDGHIYGNNGNGWACLKLETGEVLWNVRAVGKGSVCYADGMLYLFAEKDGQAGLATCSPQGLELRGTFSVAGEGPSWAHPVVTGGRLYLRYDSHLYCFDVAG